MSGDNTLKVNPAHPQQEQGNLLKQKALGKRVAGLSQSIITLQAEVLALTGVVDQNVLDIAQNAVDIALNALAIVANTTALTVHKTSFDHDAQYYNQAAVDALLAALNIKAIYIYRTANQTSNLGAGNPVEFDNYGGVGISYNTGTYRATLKDGQTYLLFGLIHMEFSTAGDIRYQWYNATGAAYIGYTSRSLTPNSTTKRTTQPVAFSLITPSGSDIDVELRCSSVTGTPTSLKYGVSWGLIISLEDLT